jgi:hypothetical protein
VEKEREKATPCIFIITAWAGESTTIPMEQKMIYHNGWWHGNNAAFIRLLADSATIVVPGNKENHGIYHAKDLAAYLGN